MSLRLNGSTSGYSELEAPAVAGDQTFTLPGTGGVLDRLNRAGNILQVVEVANTSNTQTTSTSYVNTGLSGTITPLYSSSKILIIGRSHLNSQNSTASATMQMYRGGTSGTALNSDNSVVYSASNTYTVFLAPIFYLDAPNTTSSTTYTLAVRTGAVTSYAEAGNGLFYLIEVAA